MIKSESVAKSIVRDSKMGAPSQCFVDKSLDSQDLLGEPTRSRSILLRSQLRPQSSVEAPVKGRRDDSKQVAKDNLQKLEAEIEESFKVFKQLPNQKLHPFDLNPEEIAELKTFFPEFRLRTSSSRTAKSSKGLEIPRLKELLQDKIQISEEQLDGIIKKLNHKSHNSITWTEFLMFLMNEGQRRETVNDAQLYGIGVKRLEEKDRIKLSNGESHSVEKAVEYFIDQILLVNSAKYNLVLVISENNQAKLYDARNYSQIQTLEFPSDYAMAKDKHKLPMRDVAQQSTTGLNSNPALVGSVKSQVCNSQTVLQQYTDEPTLLEPIIERPKKVEIKSKLAQRGTKSFSVLSKQAPEAKDTRPLRRYSARGAAAAQKATLTQLSTRRIAIPSQAQSMGKAESYLGRRPSIISLEEPPHTDYLGDKYAVAWKARPYRSLRPKTVMAPVEPSHMVLGITPITEPKTGQKKIQKPEEVNEIRDQVQVKEIYPDLRERYESSHKEFYEKMTEISKQVLDTERHFEKIFQKLMKEERANTEFVQRPSEVELCKRVIQRMGFKGDQANTVFATAADKHLKECRAYSNRCEIKLSHLAVNFNNCKEKLEDIVETNKYHYKMSEQTTLSKAGETKNQIGQLNLTDNASSQTLDPKACTSEMIDHYIKRLKATGKLKVEPDQRKPKIDQSRRKLLNHTKAVYALHADYNEEFGLLAIALIDREVKVYFVKQSGAKISLREFYSFYAKFPNGEAVSCLHIEKFVTNGRPIICLGSLCGNIAVYYLDATDAKGINKRPQLLKQFNFNDRCAKFETDDFDLDESAGKRHDSRKDSQVRISLKSGSFLLNNSLEESNIEGVPQASFANESIVQDPATLITDDYWENILMNTKQKKEGPDALTIWNVAQSKIFDTEVAQKFVKDLSQMKIRYDEDREFKPQIEQHVFRFLTCLRLSGNIYESALEMFREQIFSVESSEKLRVTKGQSHAMITLQKQTSSSATGRQKPPSKKQRHQSVKEDRRESIITSHDTEKDGANTQSGHQVALGKRPANEITAIRYMRDIGLIATTFTGTVKIFDSFNFYQLWKNTNQNRTAEQHTSISTFDVSQTLGLMATVGGEGRLLLIDPYALGIVNAAEAHPGVDILRVFIFSQQQQIITVASDRTICLWDAYRLEKIQTIKDQGVAHATKYSSAAFDFKSGLLYACCQQLNVWKAVVNAKVEINALQVQSLSNTVLKERNMLDMLKMSGSKQSYSSMADQRTGSVLVSKQSQLVSLIVNEQDLMNFIITVDSENLLRAWSMQDCQTEYSYKIQMKKRVTAVAVDSQSKYIAVGNCVGEVKVLTFASGSVLYNLPSQDKEITSLKFLEGREFWLISGGWFGKVILWTEPNDDNNFQISAKCRIGHQGDILVLDSAKDYIITGGIDGYLGVWNQFSGVMKFTIKLPDPVVEKNQEVANKIRKTICDVLFHPAYSNVVCVLQESGNVHCIDISNGEVIADFVAYMKINSNWACCEDQQKVFVVGDMGRASLFDIKMTKSLTVSQMSQILAKRTRRNCIYTSGYKKDFKWTMLLPWFRAHDISKMEPAYVLDVKHAKSANVFVSCTSHGEVKLWSVGRKPGDYCLSLGTLNSKDWDNSLIKGYLQIRGGQNSSFEQEGLDQSAPGSPKVQTFDERIGCDLISEDEEEDAEGE